MRRLFVVLVCLMLSVPALAADKGPDVRAKDFIKQLQQLVVLDSRAKISTVVGYPLYVDGQEAVKGAVEFLAKYDAVFVPAVKQCLHDHDMNNMVEDKGNYVVGWSCMWIGADDNGSMVILSVTTKE